MGWVQMDVAPTQEGGAKEYAFEKTIALSSATSTDSILIPDDVQSISVTASASSTTVTVYSTTDTVATVKAGSAITWLAWNAGAISTATGSVYSPVTAIKATQAGAGSSKIMVRAQ
jgi:hypothetical protein